MNESHNERVDVPELTAEEIQARVLHRDGLMLVVDKPAGLPVHRGPKGGANLESSFDARRIGSTRILPAAWCSAATARRPPHSGCCSNTAGFPRPIGLWSKAARSRTK